MREQTEKRINIKKKEAVVNIDYVKELEQRQNDASKKKSQAQASGVLKDSRFNKLFEDSEFAIDKQSESYKQLKPTEGKIKAMAIAHESEDEEQPKPKSFASLFSGKVDDEKAAASSDDDGDVKKVNNFEQKISEKKKNHKKDKIIRNYGNVNQKMRELGNNMHQSSKNIKKS